MDRYSSSDSNISMDSLEIELKKKSSTKEKVSKDNVDTILVPFYEKDVLIEVPKDKKSKNPCETIKNRNANEKFKKELPLKNYLVNKNVRKTKYTSYLEMFRKQFAPTQIDNRKKDSEIRSISPEFGDTDRESFRDAVSYPPTDFFNTESYNEMYYNRLVNQDINNYLEQVYIGQLKFNEDIRPNSPDNTQENNLKSISQISQPRRYHRRATVGPIPTIKLGGLGPDMENIRPRLERARSLQRYSEKVRMQNRVKIYKQSVQDELDKKGEHEISVKRQESAKCRDTKLHENSFLVNKNTSDKASQMLKRIYKPKSKSASGKNTRERNETKDKLISKNNNISHNTEQNKILKKRVSAKLGEPSKERTKSCDTKQSDNEDVVKQLTVNVPVPPVQINFLVNMGGLRPSSTLKKLEAKHRMYQEKVRAFTMNNDNETDNNNIN